MDNVSQFVILIVYGLLLLFILIFATIAIAMIQKHRTRNYHLKLQEAEQRAERELMKIKLEIQEEAYKKVSAEVHDNIGQVLSSVSFTLESESSKPGQERLSLLLDKSTRHIRQAIDDIRNLSRILNGSKVEQIGLIDAIATELAYLKLNKKLSTSFIHPQHHELPHLSANQTLLIFRIAQEAIQNTIRHAQATALEIKLVHNKLSDSFTMTITDNGIGFDFKGSNDNGMGLINMQERARMLGSSLVMGKGTAGGTIISITINL